MVCVISHKYRSVELAVKSNDDTGWNVPIAKVKLYSGDTFKKADESYEAAKKLGEEIARRWNECDGKK